MLPPMPDCPALVGCVCFGSQGANACICPPSEKALRAHTAPNWHPDPLTPAQREWCLNEIRSIEGHSNYADAGNTDADLARDVLNAWRDYARDKGLY